MIQTICFNFGGVLLHAQATPALQDWEVRLGIPPGETERVLYGGSIGIQVQRGDISDDAVWKRAAQKFALSAAETADFRAALTGSFYLDQDLVAWLSRLRPHYQVALISNAPDGLRQALHTLQIVGLLRHPQLQESVTSQAQALFAAMRPAGIGYSDSFMCDGDDTGAAACALVALGYPIAPSTLARYAVGDHFVTYPGELDPSLSTTARMAQALRLQTGPLPQTSRFFREQQQPDGRWVMDKWHASWLYATFLILAYLAPAGEEASVSAAGAAICGHQNTAGAWEAEGVASRMDTAFAILALTVLCRHGFATDAILEGRHRGLRWLRHEQRSPCPPNRLDWIAKTAYTVPNVDRCFELCALLADPCPFSEN